MSLLSFDQTQARGENKISKQPHGVGGGDGTGGGGLWRVVDHAQGVLHLLHDGVLGGVLKLQTKSDVVEHVKMREEGIFLKHRVHGPAVRRQVWAHYININELKALFMFYNIRQANGTKII